MFYAALATDYDGTIAHHGIVPAETVDALRWLRERGKILILVTGRELPELQALFPDITLFDAVVAENGALLFLPQRGELRPLAPPPPQELVDELRLRNVSPLSTGSSVVATWTPHETTVLEVIQSLGLEWQITFNKGAVMCLPPGINKASGLEQALAELKLSPLNVVAVGDAENDHAFLRTCGYSVAVANALESVKQEVDLVTRADHGAGVSELIHAWMDDQQDFGTTMSRHALKPRAAGAEKVRVWPAIHRVLIAGASGTGKSSLAMALIEEILASGAQLVGIDPEGDYDTLERITHLGTADRAPAIEEACALLDQPQTSLMLGLLAMPQHDRPELLATLLGRLADLRTRLGRPHWLLIDEAHHFVPAEAALPITTLATSLPGAIFVTVEPRLLSVDLLKGINFVIAPGPSARAVIEQMCELTGSSFPQLPREPGEEDAVFWDLHADSVVITASLEPEAEHQRHIRKYAEGHLGEQRSFYFRGPDGKLNLRAHNLMMFIEIADGVDDETWLHHLRRGEYSTWIRDQLGDDELAAEVRDVETGENGEPQGTRALVRAAIERRYTSPAS
jgi:hydroxymethylpyrimidine pyrophosphatase-like HAD family hydrolase